MTVLLFSMQAFSVMLFLFKKLNVKNSVYENNNANQNMLIKQSWTDACRL